MTARTRKPTAAPTTTTPEVPTVPTVPATAVAPAKHTRKVAPPIDLSALVVESAPLPVKANAIAAQDNPAMGWLRKSWSEKQATGPGTFRGSGQQVSVPEANGTMVSNLIRSAATAMSNATGERIGAAVQIVPARQKDNEGKYNGPLIPGMVFVRFCAKTQKAPVAKKATTTP